jgi:hypothetical protein
LNRQGKQQAAKTIASSIKEIFKLQKRDPIKMSWKEKQKGNAISNNVDKKSGQIINKQEAIKNQE